MTLRIKHKVNVRIATDANMYNLIFGPSEHLSEVTIDDYTKSAGGTFNIAQGTNEDLSFGDVDSVYGLYIKADQNVVLKFNNGNETLTLRKSGSTEFDFAQIFIEGVFTAVNIAAPADQDVTGTWCVWGE